MRRDEVHSLHRWGVTVYFAGCLTMAFCGELVTFDMLQMVSHGLIGASLFFLVGATYDRTHTLMLDEMGGVGQKMRKIFAMFTACSMASLALPGMGAVPARSNLCQNLFSVKRGTNLPRRCLSP